VAFFFRVFATYYKINPLIILVKIENAYPMSKLLCAVCKDSSFTNPWDLMIHVQAAHGKNIYEIGNTDNEKDVDGNTNGVENSNGHVHGNGIECEHSDEKNDVSLLNT
jgi:hypothetical protein